MELEQFPSHALNLSFLKKIFFIAFAITVVPSFPSFPPSTKHLPLPQTIPTPLFMAWVIHINSLATPFPILYFTSPWLFCNSLFVLLHPLTSSPILPHFPQTWKPFQTFSISRILSLFFFLFRFFFFQIQLFIDIYFLPFYVHSFDLLCLK